MSDRIRFVCAAYPGVLQWLRHGADEDLWDLTELNSDAATQVPEGAATYGFGGWHSSYTEFAKELSDQRIPFGVAWSSSPQESDTSRTEIELAHLMALTLPAAPFHPHWWGCLHPGLAQVLPDSVYLPGPIHLPPRGTERVRDDWIGFFSPGTEKKAVFSQLIAVRMFQKANPRVVLQTNLGRYKPVLDWLKIRYELHPWLPREQLLNVLGHCRLVLNASLAESFGYSCVDAMGQGTPVVGSRAIRWLPESWKVGDPNDPESVLRKIQHLWEMPLPPARTFLEIAAKQQNEAARLAVESILGKVLEAARVKA